MTDRQAFEIFKECGLVRGWEQTVYHSIMIACVFAFISVLFLGMILNTRTGRACVSYGYPTFEWHGNDAMCVDDGGNRFALKELQKK